MKLQGRDLSVDLSGEDVHLLHKELASIDLHAPDEEQQEATFGPGTKKLVVAFQKAHKLKQTGIVDDQTAAEINRAVDEVQPNQAPENKQDQQPEAPAEQRYRVTGVVVSRASASLGGLDVEIVDRNVGMPDTSLSNAVTDDVGRFTSSFAASAITAGKKLPDLQALVSGSEGRIATSDTAYNAGPITQLIVEVPEDAAGLPSEHDTLLSAVRTHFNGPLTDLQETSERSDVTYLANKTGWDARAVAFASLAQRHADDSRQGRDEGIHPAFFYALLRAGVPADPAGLYRTAPDAVGNIWKAAISRGVIGSELAGSLDSNLEKFRALAARGRLDAQVADGVASLRDLARLEFGNGKEADTRIARFGTLLSDHDGNPDRLWAAAEDEFGKAQRFA